MNDRLRLYAAFIHELLDSAMEQSDTVSPHIRVGMAEKIACILSKMKDMGLEQLSEEEITELGIPVTLIKGDKK